MVQNIHANFFSSQIANDRLLGVVYSLEKLLDSGNMLVKGNDSGYALYKEYCIWFKKHNDAKFEEGCFCGAISTRTLSSLKQNKMYSISDVLEYIWKYPLTNMKGIGRNGAYTIMRWIAHRAQIYKQQ